MARELLSIASMHLFNGQESFSAIKRESDTRYKHIEKSRGKARAGVSHRVCRKRIQPPRRAECREHRASSFSTIYLAVNAFHRVTEPINIKARAGKSKVLHFVLNSRPPRTLSAFSVDRSNRMTCFQLLRLEAPSIRAPCLIRTLKFLAGTPVSIIGRSSGASICVPLLTKLVEIKKGGEKRSRREREGRGKGGKVEETKEERGGKTRRGEDCIALAEKE